VLPSPKKISLRNVQTAKAGLGRQEWSDWGERHGRQSREVTVERSGNCRDTTFTDLRRAVAHEQDIRDWEQGAGLTPEDFRQ
jgi:hypothetical protein